MTNEELADWLNSALGLSGPKKVTPNVIRQWVSWKVLPESIAKGRSRGLNPQWSRSGVAVRRARRLAEFRKQGVNRKNAIILRAFVEWGHPDFEMVRLALQVEFQRGRNKLIRRKTTFMDGMEFAALSPGKANAIAHQNGPLDSRFVGTPLEQSREFYAVISQFAYDGGQNPTHVIELVMAALTKALPEALEVISKRQVRQFIDANAGLIGASDETNNAVEQEISNLSDARLLEARKFIRLAMILYRQIPRYQIIFAHFNFDDWLLDLISELAPQLLNEAWLSMSLVTFAKSGISCPKVGQIYLPRGADFI